MKLNLILFLAFSIITDVIFSNCSTPNQPKECDVSLWVPFNRGPIPFDKEKWSRLIDTTPSYVGAEIYELLEIRERMVCNLIQNKLNENSVYDSVVTLLGPGLKGEMKNLCMNVSFEPYISADVLSNQIATRKALLYEVGYNGSGDNFLLLEFKNGKFWKCRRAEAR